MNIESEKRQSTAKTTSAGVKNADAGAGLEVQAAADIGGWEGLHRKRQQL